MNRTALSRTSPSGARIVASVAVVLFGLGSHLACRDSRGGVPGLGGGGTAFQRQAVMSESAAPPAAPPAPVAAPAPDAPAVQDPIERKVVRNGTLSVEVPDLGKAMDAVRSAAAAAGGYVTNETQGRDEYDVRQGTLTCRVPATKLDATVAAFQGLGRLISVSIQADDITDQYFDMETRLKNQRQLEGRLVALFDRPGNKVTDLLEVEREVARVRGEIENLEGRKRLWDNQIQLSTLAVELREPRPVIGSDTGGIGGTLSRAFRSAGQNVVETLAWFIAASGVAVPAGLLLWLLWRLIRAIRNRRRTR